MQGTTDRQTDGQTCRMPSSGWKASPANGDSVCSLLYLWWMWCSMLQRPHITKTNRTHLVLFGMQNRNMSPYLWWMWCSMLQRPHITKTNRINLVLSGMQNRNLVPIWQPHIRPLFQS
jgi:hypothetical protein